MASRRSAREIWFSMDVEVRFREHLQEFSYCRGRYRSIRRRMNQGDYSDQVEYNELIIRLDALNRRINEKRRSYNELRRARYKLHLEIYELTDRLLEEIRTKTPFEEHVRRIDAVELQYLFDLFAIHLDPTTRIIVKYLTYYCMERHRYIHVCADRRRYDEMTPYYKYLPGLGEAVLIMGHRYRREFRHFIRAKYPSKTVTARQFAEFISSSLIENFGFFFLPHATHVTYLIVTAFAMEVIYYILDFATIWRKDRMTLTVSVLCSFLSSDEFKKSGGLNTFLWYANAVYQGHKLVLPFDDVNTILWEDKCALEMSWSFLDEDPHRLPRSLPILPTRSLGRLERLPAGTEAWNIAYVLPSL